MENKEPASSVLIVDDDKSTIELLKMLLTNKGFNVGVAAGQEALDYMKQKKFDIIITDLKMPEINGYQLLNIIKTTHREQKVMVMSTIYDRSMSAIRTDGRAWRSSTIARWSSASATRTPT